MSELRIVGVDPGPRGGAYAIVSQIGVNRPRLISAGIWEGYPPVFHDGDLWIERIVPQGRSVGQETFDTATMIGMILQKHHHQMATEQSGAPCLVRRRSVVAEILGSSPGSTDAHVKNRLVEIFGEVGTKKAPGPLFALRGMGTHGFAALAVAYYGLLGRGRQGHDWWKFNYETGRCE